MLCGFVRLASDVRRKARAGAIIVGAALLVSACDGGAETYSGHLGNDMAMNDMAMNEMPMNEMPMNDMATNDMATNDMAMNDIGMENASDTALEANGGNETVGPLKQRVEMPRVTTRAPARSAPLGRAPAAAEPSNPRIARLCSAAELSGAACASLDNQFQNLEGGVGALNAPAAMQVGNSYTAVLAIGREEDQAEVQEAAEAEAGPAATSEVGDVHLAQHMRVTLSGSAFRIEPEGDAERELGLSRQETWRWQVTPTTDGPQSLVATVVPIARLPDGRTLTLEPARRRLDVQVRVTAEQQMGRWERLLKSTTGVLLAIAALIAAISLIVWRIRNLGRKPD